MLRRLLSPVFLLPLGLALFVGGAKLALLHFYSSDLPFSDQWAAEGNAVVRWILGAQMQWSFFFFPHGEHTPALTRIVDLGLFWLNGDQWDSRVEMLASVALHVLGVLVLWQFVCVALARRWRPAGAALAAVLFSLPSNYENFLWGFQTQFLFLLLFGAAHVWGTLREERVGASWLLAQLAGVCGLFSIASGWVSAVALGAVACWRLRENPRHRWAWATLVVNLALSLAGWSLLHRAFYTPGHAASFPWQFLEALGHLLSWPLPGPFGALFLQLPALVFGWTCRRRLGEPPVRLLAGLILWSWLLAAAFAYGRGSTPSEIAVRYFDPLTVGLMANGLALGWLLGRRLDRLRSVQIAVGLVWLIVLGAGLRTQNKPDDLDHNLARQREFYQRERQVLLAFLASGHPAALETDREVRQFFPHFRDTIDVLSDPLTRTALPPSICLPLPVQRDAARSSPAGITWTQALATPTGRRALQIAGGRNGAVLVSFPLVGVSRPVLQFQLLGRLGPGEGEVYLEDAAGARRYPAEATVDSAGRWKTINLLGGEGPLRLVAKAAAGTQLALTEPVEVGWLSWLAPKVASGWAWLLGAGTVCLLAGTVRSRRGAPEN
ncbi:MAG: hypothetical protein HY302_08915 [Opitutae bacterium]|nr:hypothetical protein [Opitutae bacterium]